MTAIRLTRAIEKRITADWQREIPGLGVYRMRHLLRRVGPLLVGVCLDRDSGGAKYKPCFHVHNLAIEFPTVSLTLCSQLRAVSSGGPDYIEVEWHEQKFVEAAARMAQQALLPLAGDIPMRDVISAYRGFVATPFGEGDMALFHDMITILAWARRRDEASRVLEEVLTTVPNGDRTYENVGGHTAFLRECQKAIEAPELLDKIVESQIDALKVRELPVAELLP